MTQFGPILPAPGSCLIGSDKKGIVNMVASKMALSQPAPAVLPAALPNSRSSLVRRLVAAENDPAKRRIRAWLANLEDERRSRLGLTPRDIVILRRTQEGIPPRHGASRVCL